MPAIRCPGGLRQGRRRGLSLPSGAGLPLTARHRQGRAGGNTAEKFMKL